jgi:hypothetical protein
MFIIISISSYSLTKISSFSCSGCFQPRATNFPFLVKACIRTPEFYNSRSPNGLWVKKFFMKTGDNDSGFFPHYQSLIIVTTIDLSIVNNASQTGKRVTVFHWPAKVCYPCMAWTNFINRPKTSRPWLYLTKHHKMLKRKFRYLIIIILNFIADSFYTNKSFMPNT